MEIKAIYKDIHAILLENKNRKVSTVLALLEPLMESKVTSSTLRRDDEGNVTHIFCYYHKEWEDVTEHEYGVKKSTASGLNTMCKAGVREWTREKREQRNARAKLLEDFAAGKVTLEEVQEQS